MKNFDLLQNEAQIKTVFNAKNDFVPKLFNQIGKIQVGSTCDRVPPGIRNDVYVKQMFDFDTYQVPS